MSLNDVRAIVFDVDGTLYHHRSLRRRVLLELASRSFLHPISQRKTIPILRAYRRAQELARTRPHTLDAREMQLQIACELSREAPDLVHRTAAEWIHQRPLRHLRNHMLPGLLDFLSAARKRGIRLGVVSDYPAAEKLKAMGIIGYFDVVVSSYDDHIARFKPDPTGLRECLRRLDSQPQESIYIGDRLEVDQPCAANAGTDFILIGAPSARQDCVAARGYGDLSRLFGFSH
jgi:HAD superfamily hydrolase (TIGR01549 family)